MEMRPFNETRPRADRIPPERTFPADSRRVSEIFPAKDPTGEASGRLARQVSQSRIISREYRSIFALASGVDSLT